MSLTNNKFQYLFDGIMLSDGCISKNEKSKNFAFTQKCKHKEWLDIIINQLAYDKIEFKIIKGKPSSNSYSKKEHYILYSNHDIFFTNQHKRWYIKYYNIDEYPITMWHFDKESEDYFIWKKIVPKDIILTPECILNWYLGDGSIGNSYDIYYQIQLATNGFVKKDVERLIFLLNEEIVDRAHYFRNTILINSISDIKKFFNYISYLKRPNCYSYKFPEKLIY